jgi:hypothetical protein
MWAFLKITDKLELVKGFLEGVSLWKDLMEDVSLCNDYWLTLWKDFWKVWACERILWKMWACELITENLEIVKIKILVWACERVLLKMWACELITEKLVSVCEGLLAGVSLWKDRMEEMSFCNNYWKAWACERTSVRCKPVKGSYGRCWLVKWLRKSFSLWNDFWRCELVKESDGKCGLVIWFLKSLSLWKDFWKRCAPGKGFVENVCLWKDYWKAWACERTSGRCEPVKGSCGKCGFVKWLLKSLSLWKDFWKVWACERALWKMWACEMINEKLEFVKGSSERCELLKDSYGKVWAC